MKSFRRLIALATFALALAAGAQTQPVSTAKPYSSGVIVTPLLKTSVTGAGQPIVYLQTDSPQVTAVMVEIPPGRQTGWHKHPVPCFAYVIQGAISVELEDGSIHEYHAGQAIAEVINLLHNGTNHGTESVKIVLFAMGSKDSPFSVATSAPTPAPSEK